MNVLPDRWRAAVVRPLENRLDLAATAFLDAAPGGAPDFSTPPGEESFSPPDSVSWRVFKNPVALFVGGVAAVLLEFADPRVRAGVWEHSTFRQDPVGRLRRTGLAAMVTVYGARSRSERMIAKVRRMHDRVVGVTAAGEAYRANDPSLLTWVHATASFGFLEAYSRYVAPLSSLERDRFFAEGRRSAAAYGADRAPASVADWEKLVSEWTPRFEPSPEIREFIAIMRAAPALPGAMQISQRLFIRAAVDLLPTPARESLGLGGRDGLRPFEDLLVKRMGRRADRLILRSSPAVQACRRVGLPETYLYPHRAG